MQGVREATNIRRVVASSLTLTWKGLSLMRITSLKLHTSHLTANEEALLRCETALELKDKGDYEGARKAMDPLWRRVGDRPETEGFIPP